MPEGAKDRDFRENLDVTVISIPLLDEMEKAGDDEDLGVIVEINLMHHEGRESTKNLVAGLLEEVKGRVQGKLAEDADKFVFATLTKGEIEELVRLNDAKRSEGQGESNLQTRWRSPIYKIWPDFEVELLVNESVSTVKADAARAAFGAGGDGVVWAVVDTGIDGEHAHFQKHHNLELGAPLQHWDFSGDVPRSLAKPEDPNGHGTHVAGIIAGEAEGDADAIVRCLDEKGDVRHERRTLSGLRGMAPRTKLVSFKVYDEKNKKVHAKNIIAALARIRKFNGDGKLPHIHGVNISLGHEFRPEWFACGQSPLCVEVDRLVRSGTTVVVAAGNGGYGAVDTTFKGRMHAPLAGTIRDPANASLAITVGSTHRYMPHVYGVSYFSAKGPTGDGRLKPDLVAPGEKIISCCAEVRQKADCGGNHPTTYAEDSGTSMAAPHVSGCIAAFLSIRREFRSRPEKVREIFLSTATDLGRERYYQGHGLVDLMRAIQSV